MLITQRLDVYNWVASIGIYPYEKKNTDFNIIIYSHTSRTSKNSCSIVISHPYYTSFTPTYIVVVVTVAVVTVITHYIHPYYNCLPNLVIYHQSIIPTCTAISHPYLHTNLTSLPTYIHCCCHCCHSCCCYTQLLLLLLMMLLMVVIIPFYPTTTDHQNFHFGLFCTPNQHSITRKLLQNSPFFWITL